MLATTNTLKNTSSMPKRCSRIAAAGGNVGFGPHASATSSYLEYRSSCPSAVLCDGAKNRVAQKEKLAVSNRRRHICVESRIPYFVGNCVLLASYGVRGDEYGMNNTGEEMCVFAASR